MKTKRKSPRALTLRRVREALASVLPGVPPRRFGVRASLVADLGIDSLKLAELSLALERLFDRPIFLGEVLTDLPDPGRVTVGDLAAYLDEEG